MPIRSVTKMTSEELRLIEELQPVFLQYLGTQLWKDDDLVVCQEDYRAGETYLMHSQRCPCSPMIIPDAVPRNSDAGLWWMIKWELASLSTLGNGEVSALAWNEPGERPCRIIIGGLYVTLLRIIKWQDTHYLL
jgi:hypothetical protein